MTTSFLDIGFESIGNATIIAYDKTPVLATDPWVQGAAYFGSWAMTHTIPPAQRDAILAAPFVWFSHGHPDHLNPDSLPLFKGKRILVPNHFGNRIRDDLRTQGFNVEVLPDRKWVKLSERVKILCIADLGQDAVLLIDINGRLLVNTNDCGENGWGWFVNRIVKQYQTSILFSLSGYGDADMNHFFDESGKFIPPEGMARKPFGAAIAENCEKRGVSHFAVSSSLHRYQRTDSLWANAMIPELSDYEVGFKSDRCKMLPAFVRYDCGNDQWEKINPAAAPEETFAPEKFGDSWSDQLSAEDVKSAEKYFQAIESLQDNLGFITLRVGGKEHTITIGDTVASRGVTFEVPRGSLNTAIQYEIFDDLLIGNFMKTTLHGPWPRVSLHPHFTAYVTKYADNGRAKTRTEVKQYIAEYERRSFRLKLLRWEGQAKSALRSVAREESAAVRLAKAVYRSKIFTRR